MQQYFAKLKSNLELNSSFQEKITQHHSAVRSKVEKFDPKITTKLIGSLQKKTRIQPKDNDPLPFDIDILVNLGEVDHWIYDGSGVSPEDVILKVYESVDESDRYNPQVDEPTVTFKYADGVKVELVPAYLDNIGHSPDGTEHSPKGRSYWIIKDGRWKLADYDHDASMITLHNDGSNGTLVPLIKMLKAIKKEHFADLMDSFHLEVLATITIPSESNIGDANLIAGFFRDGLSYLDGGIRLPSSNTNHLTVNPLYLLEIKKAFRELHRRIEYINSVDNKGKQIELWRDIFGDYFPTSI